MECLQSTPLLFFILTQIDLIRKIAQKCCINIHWTAVEFETGRSFICCKDGGKRVPRWEKEEEEGLTYGLSILL